jgi:peptidoglycan/xylan/chitin deacetylase (PgdA/CDA1 family)
LAITPTLWRTPWGDTAPWTEQIATDHNLRIIGWTVDTHDWRGDDAEQMYAATRAELNDGAIVLAHDGLGPGATRGHVAETAAYVEQVAAHGRRHQLALAALA